MSGGPVTRMLRARVSFRLARRPALGGMVAQRWPVRFSRTRFRLARLTLQERCAGASGPAAPPSAIGMTWSACHGSSGRGPSPQSQHRSAVARMTAACLRYWPPYPGLPPLPLRMAACSAFTFVRNAAWHSSHREPDAGLPQSRHGRLTVLPSSTSVRFVVRLRRGASTTTTMPVS